MPINVSEVLCQVCLPPNLPGFVVVILLGFSLIHYTFTESIHVGHYVSFGDTILSRINLCL